MHKVELRYDFAARRQDGWVRNGLIDLLHAVQEHGSISGAARELGLSYRHVWGELRRWEAQLAHPLIVWEKGQRARLAPFGEKLLWAERQAPGPPAPPIQAPHAQTGPARPADRGPACRTGAGLRRGLRRRRAGAHAVRQP